MCPRGPEGLMSSSYRMNYITSKTRFQRHSATMWTSNNYWMTFQHLTEMWKTLFWAIYLSRNCDHKKEYIISYWISTAVRSDENSIAIKLLTSVHSKLLLFPLKSEFSCVFNPDEKLQVSKLQESRDVIVHDNGRVIQCCVWMISHGLIYSHH